MQCDTLQSLVIDVLDDNHTGMQSTPEQNKDEAPRYGEAGRR